jgi:hypothetical protein
MLILTPYDLASWATMRGNFIDDRNDWRGFAGLRPVESE